MVKLLESIIMNNNEFNLTDKHTISDLIKYLQSLADGYGDLPLEYTLVVEDQLIIPQTIFVELADDKLFIDFAD